MKLGVIADDFTGASDIALTLAEGGMRTALFTDMPETADGIEAGVVALKSRTNPAEEAVALSLAALDRLLALGCAQIVFKYCSTFDSTADGNIGPVAAALADRLGEERVIACPAFPATGRTVFQGHLFVGDRPLHETGMRDHPLTPMRDSDLRRVLAAQTGWPVAHIPAATVFEGPDAIRAALEGPRAMLIVDAVRDDDLRAIGAAAKDRKLITGGSGIALGLPANFGATAGRPAWRGAPGPAAALSGSCSEATRGQVARYRDKAPAREVSADDAMAGRLDPQALADWALAQETPPLIYSSADPDAVRAAQERHGREALADRIERLFADTAAALVARGATRIVAAGGETSGAVVGALKPGALEIGPAIAPGVPALRAAGRPLALALKSGNFGGPDFFAEALEALR